MTSSSAFTKRIGAVRRRSSPSAALRAEHADKLLRIPARTNPFIPPTTPAQAGDPPYAGLAKFAADLAERIAIENEVL
jgi:iron-sulfur cluster repair protein YtfE (RIC family)